jgi:hypothetical protein
MTTTNDTTAGQAMAVLKRDGQGRVRMPATRREQLLDEFERSGLSGPKFAVLAGLKYQTFATWVQKRKRQRGAAKVPATTSERMKWLEAVVEQAHETVDLTEATTLVLQLSIRCPPLGGDRKPPRVTPFISHQVVPFACFSTSVIHTVCCSLVRHRPDSL